MKTATRMIMFTLAMFFFAGQAFSQSATSSSSKDVKKENITATGQGKFVDDNKNGICDNWEANHRDGKNCPQYDNCCKGKANDNCCKGKANTNCGKGSANCSGKGSVNCSGMSSANCQGPCKGQVKSGNKSSSQTPAPDKGDSK